MYLYYILFYFFINPSAYVKEFYKAENAAFMQQQNAYRLQKNAEFHKESEKIAEEIKTLREREDKFKADQIKKVYEAV